MSNSTTHFRETIKHDGARDLLVEVTTWHDIEGAPTRLHVGGNNDELSVTTARALLHSLARAVTVLEAVDGQLDYRLCGFKSR